MAYGSGTNSPKPYGPNESAGWIMSTLGAIALLVIYRVAQRRRAL